MWNDSEKIILLKKQVPDSIHVSGAGRRAKPKEWFEVNLVMIAKHIATAVNGMHSEL